MEPQSSKDYYLESTAKVEQDSRRDGLELDKMTLYLISGSIAISVTIIGQILERGVVALWLFIFSWSILLLALFFHYISYILNEKQNKLRMYNLQEWARKNFKPPTFDSRTKFSKWVTCANTVTRIFLLVGLSTLMIVVSTNIINVNSMNKKQPVTKATENLIAPYNLPPQQVQTTTSTPPQPPKDDATSTNTADTGSNTN